MQTWANKHGIQIEYIQPGQPQQNAYIERFNRTVRYDWLAQQLFDTIDEVQNQATRWMWHYNHERPNMAWAASPLISGWAWPRNATSADR